MSKSIGKEKTITYSPAFTLVPTYECFNRCTYCNFRQEGGVAWLSLDEARLQLELLKDQGIIEILLLSGEVHPQDPRRERWFQRLYDLAELALELGFLPHTNAGILTHREMTAFKQVNASLGLMLENISERLGQTVHQHAPSKVPKVRLEQLVWAGELQIAFTTGLLLGIGETHLERIATLEAIAQIHQNYGHIQEVILQPQRIGQKQQFLAEEISSDRLRELVIIARELLPTEIAIQVPPNLVDNLEELLAAGVDDLGGISPIDVVNPDYEQPDVKHLHKSLGATGWQLEARLPIYPHLDHTLSPRVAQVCDKYRTCTNLDSDPQSKQKPLRYFESP